jgi:hypothetical protein
MTINSVHTIIRGVHICFQTVILYGCNFVSGYDQHAADELFVHNILQTDKACFTCEGVFNVHNSHLWALDNPHAVHIHGYEVRFSISVWAGIIRDILMGACLLSDSLTAQWYCDFLDTVLPGLLEGMPLAVRQRLWFQHDSSSMLWERCPAMVECNISRKVDWTWRTDCMASLVAGSNSDGFFNVRTPEWASLHSLFQDY